ncbi:MAG: radical SAM protein [Vicinamibacterales bacterium]
MSAHIVRDLARSAALGLTVLRATAHRPPAPFKLNFCLTYWCQYKCKTCNIWQRKPTDELTLDEIATFVRENQNVTWLDLTGGEIFLRRDIDDIFDVIVDGWPRLALLHFPTNGFLTDRIVHSVERIAGRGPARTIVTVSLDGDEALNDEIRGVKGGFRRQIDTFKALRRIPGVVTALGMTLSTHNLSAFDATFAACRRECPDLTMDDIHLNVAQRSGHYYANTESDAFAPEPGAARQVMRLYRQRKGPARTPRQLLENAYLKRLDKFLETGRTPEPCHALRASCFIDPWGVVYPCITYSRPMGRLRDTGMRLDPIWNDPRTREVQREIWDGQCPQCWTACEAYQSILGNALALRRRPPDVRAIVGPSPSPSTEVPR